MKLIAHYLGGTPPRFRWTCNHPAVRISVMMTDDTEVWICRLAVDQIARGNGIGTEALKEIIKQFRTMPIILYALADEPCHQHSLERWYRRHGFRAFGPQARCKHNGALLMRRPPDFNY